VKGGVPYDPTMTGDPEEPRRGNKVQQRWAAFADKHLVEDTVTRQSGRWAPRLYRIPIVVPALLISMGFVPCGGLASLGRPARKLND
jgi:hypothetical protein